MLKTAICNLFGIQYPIIQGGMAYLATAELASAVSNAGGLGVIAAGAYDGSWLRRQIQLTRQSTAKPFGVNIYLPSPFLKEQIDIIIRERVSVVITGSGNPSIYISEFNKAGIKVIPVVASVEQARKMENNGANAVVAEGMEAGGHVGSATTMSLVPQVIDAVRIPVVAAGGIADGRGLIAALSIGAQGIQMGTRFICSEECVAHSNFKNRLIKSNDNDTELIGRSIGKPVRCLRNRFTRKYIELEQAGVAAEELNAISRGRYFSGVINGDVDEGILMAGQVSGLIRDIKPARSIIQDIILQATSIICDLYRQDRGE